MYGRGFWMKRRSPLMKALTSEGQNEQATMDDHQGQEVAERE